jgi:hypothetical protein
MTKQREAAQENLDSALKGMDGPAVIRPHHELRPATNDQGTAITGKLAWRNSCQLQAALDQGKLNSEIGDKWSGWDRFSCAKEYQKIYDMTESTGGIDSTQAMNVSRSSRCGSGNDARDRAWDLRLSLESNLSERDRIIIRKVCGEGCTPAQGVALISPGYKHTVWARFREALDSLCEAFEMVRKQPGVFNLERK